ncbi:hypothetical protein LRAMOSA04558 [Lichtheimia ramosa]|uniref:NTF2 domain-containing protein n=1 Tax=Lichtheimia ramosa TaxID=688394 RepID=A0A077WZD1_9FUNG|nr:hypothetical protein LRAMOSA04558 [Lichtheimia ramosa]
MSWRGRGQSRGNRGGNRGGFQQRNDFEDSFGSSNSSSSSVLSRLGPMNGGGSVSSGSHQDRFSDNYRSNSPRGGGGGGGHRSFDNSRQYNDNDRRYNDGGNFNRGGGGGGPRGGFRSDNQRFQQQQSFNRGRGRGGGGGRRQYTRKFVDEDIEMGQSINIPPGAIVVSITGHPEGTDEKLLSFLQRKVRVPWEARSFQSSGGTMYIEVGTEEEANGICRCNNFQFYGVDLKIRREDEGGNAPRNTQSRHGGGTGGRSRVLEEFLQERWDPQNGFLSLDELPETKHGIGLVISKLLRAANDLYGDNVITISFARNGLWSLKPIQSLADIFPRIQNLSVQDNDIAEFRSLDAFAKKNLPNLTELLLMGNPIQTNNTWERYQSEVLQRFPNISMLDMQPVGNAPPPQQGISPSSSTGFAPTNISTPPQPRVGLPMGSPQVQGSFYDGENSRQATEDFLTKFFPLFDSNRQALVDLYDPQAGFSIGVSSMAAKGSWGQLPRLTMGNENIIKRMLTLPPTIHGLSRPENFVMDAWQTQGSQTHPVILFLTVHGEFNEATGAKGAQYSFDRAMLVAPAIAGSRAQMAGWQYVILSDSLMVRDYTGNMGFRPTA